MRANPETRRAAAHLLERMKEPSYPLDLGVAVTEAHIAAGKAGYWADGSMSESIIATIRAFLEVLAKEDPTR